MTAPDGYRHLTLQKRDWLSMNFKRGISFRKIAAEMNVDHTTLEREIKRNGDLKNGVWTYDASIAHMRYEYRKRKTHTPKIARNSILESFIKSKLEKNKWSPHVISGCLKKEFPQLYVSHETIYNYIYNKRPEWIVLLPEGKKRRKRKNNRKNRVKSTIKNRVSKDLRPKSVETRKTFGHYEVDTIVTKQTKEAILVILERKTRKIKLRKLDRKTAAEVRDKLVQALGHFRSSVKTITYDNGTENAYHEEVNKELKCKSYFCNPYHSWEKGSVENVIGLIRRFIPKKKNLAEVTERELREIEYIINHRPRKILDYETPNQLFEKEWCTYR